MAGLRHLAVESPDHTPLMRSPTLTTADWNLFRITCALILIICLGFLLRIGGEILSPLAASFLISLLLLPLNRRLERVMPRSLAIILCILLVVLVLGGLLWFFSAQAIGFQDQLPQIQARAMQLLLELQAYIEQRFHIDADQQVRYLEQAGNSMVGEGGQIVGQISGFTGDLFTVLGLMPIYIFFILYYRTFFMEFLARLFQRQGSTRVRGVAGQIEKVSQSYLLGLLTVIVTVATLNTIGLLILGIENALFFGLLASLLAVIPYIGIAIGSILPAMVALVTKDSAWYAVGVVGVMLFVQFLEGNFITPMVVGSRVSVNQLVAVLALLVAAALWGAVGMVLAIPFTAILKVICDNVEALKPLGFLLGEAPTRKRAALSAED